MRSPNVQGSRLPDKNCAQSTNTGMAGLADIAAFLRRYRWTIYLPIVVALVCAIAYVELTTSTYTSASRVLVDPQAARGFQEENASLREIVDTATIESRAEAIQ